MAKTHIRGRIHPKKRAWTQVFFRAGIKFTNDWQSHWVDDATRRTLEAEQMLEIEPVETVGELVPDSAEAATDDSVFVDELQAYASSVFVDELQAYAATKVVLPEAAAVEEALAEAAPKVVLPEAGAVVVAEAVEEALAEAAPKVVLPEAGAVVVAEAVEEPLAEADVAATAEAGSNATPGKKSGKK